MNNIEDSKRMAKLLSEARYKVGVSQEQMAMALRVSKNTIYNFEKGTSTPDLFQFMAWYETLGLNPTSYILQYMNPYEFDGLSAEASEEQIQESLNTLLNELTPHQKRCVLYLLFGSYQGDPYAMLQLFVAHAHLPMHYRFSIANTILETYKMCEKCGDLKDTSHVMPDIETLEKAVRQGREAAINGKDGYVT
ncbi:MAG: helix-turn-helix transcriptional regulator [bacterium]|nr:helix-turn-helix transcriptional regulator [bacterium]